MDMPWCHWLCIGFVLFCAMHGMMEMNELVKGKGDSIFSLGRFTLESK